MLGSVQGSQTVFGVPPSHRGKQLANYDWSARPNTAERVAQFIYAAEAGKAPHLILTGSVGTGKTHIAVGLYRWAVLHVGPSAPPSSPADASIRT